MKVIVARTAGFCRGVRDALDVTLEAIKSPQTGESICTFGPLIHNRQVLAMLEEKGITAEDQIENCAGKRVVIRAHGIPPQERKKLRKLGASLLDATCKRVARVQAAIKRHARKGFHTVIAGDADHAEVIGLMGYTEGRGVVINRPEQVDDLPANWENVLLVAQTTQNEEIFKAIQEKFRQKYPNAMIKNTICGSTHERQSEVREMCSRVEAIVIVGGYHSGNTIRLAEVARECKIPTYHVETEAELDTQEMARYTSVGVSAGASTPNWMIRNVVRLLESIEPERNGTRYRINRTLEQLVYSNVFVALSAALLASAGQALTGFPIALGQCLMAAFYVFAMHTLNLYLDRDAMRLNDPGRAAFYQQWKGAFTSISIVAVVVSLWMAVNTGILTFLALGLLVLFGVLYAVPVFLPSYWQNISALKIKDIPGSKTFFVPIAWASATVLLPHLPRFWSGFGGALYAFWVIALLVLIRTALLDLLAVQGDRLVGKETIVVLLGENKTAHFMSAILVLLAVSLLLGPVSGLSTTFAYLMLPGVAAYGWFLRMCFQKPLKEDPVFETMIESVLIGIGTVALLWT
ncbi:4-hydroxy-3-methylbut-2-enyl diphosphate reductase [Desulfoferrobacter suflitae]|uniref:4-hydroxy-3-methylbut-2-enyl diphosphate reductase n=1 Tax=Desulfoferrobacter suflitae TaxID=2865782 RepID=UPI002164536B|nr:4-hydroxy-3-methylbut-2-enyl diphosphate reductase [Desulfoferrobacter suflitae]MCK8600687.1 4-hydroxy-3-methylbut-2-enyl diphosphate reductase [Desulfoferrobacter suflitae]